MSLAMLLLRVVVNKTGETQGRLRKHSTLIFGESRTGKDDTEALLAADANLVADMR